jgi:HupE / UreJ protein
VLGGADHLLFLLTILVAAAGWRYWLGVVTSFTIAHSITLAVSALGVLRLPAEVIEPGIAASIVIMAVLNLWFVYSKRSVSARARIAVVFGCGLLHGFGFASAIGAMAVDAGSRIATLAGFNLGIELGQFAFVATMLLLAGMVRRYLRDLQEFPIAIVASILAAVLGAAMLASRVTALVHSA